MEETKINTHQGKSIAGLIAGLLTDLKFFSQMSNGKRKVSCVVDCESLKTFQVEYCKMLRENMNSLPRRPQNKKKKKSAAN